MCFGSQRERQEQPAGTGRQQQLEVEREAYLRKVVEGQLRAAIDGRELGPLEAAIAAGSDSVRVGSSIFGAREYKASKP